MRASHRWPVLHADHARQPVGRRHGDRVGDAHAQGRQRVPRDCAQPGQPARTLEARDRGHPRREAHGQRGRLRRRLLVGRVQHLRAGRRDEQARVRHAPRPCWAGCVGCARVVLHDVLVSVSPRAAWHNCWAHDGLLRLSQVGGAAPPAPAVRPLLCRRPVAHAAGQGPHQDGGRPVPGRPARGCQDLHGHAQRLVQGAGAAPDRGWFAR